MKLDERKLGQLVLIATIGLVLVLLARPFSTWHWTQAASIFWYDFSWIGVATLVITLLNTYLIRRKLGAISIAQYSWLVIPFASSVFFYAKAGAAIHGFAFKPEAYFCRQYSLYTTAFFATILFWIVGFPHEHVWGPVSSLAKLIWKSILSIAGLSLFILVVWQMDVSSRYLTDPIRNSAFWSLQQSAQTFTALLFVFLVLRIILPLGLILGWQSFRRSHVDVHPPTT